MMRNHHDFFVPFVSFRSGYALYLLDVSTYAFFQRVNVSPLSTVLSSGLRIPDKIMEGLGQVHTL